MKAILLGLSLTAILAAGLIRDASHNRAISARSSSRSPGASSAPWDPSPCIRDPAALGPIPASPEGFLTDYLHTCGGQLYDAAGHLVQITGVSWFGFETSTFAPHGLDRRNWRSILDQVATLGFNTLRVPYTNEMLQPNARVSGIDYLLNPDLRDLTPLDLLDHLIAGARERGLRVILDRHRPDSSSQSPLWYTEKVPEEQWIADWRMLARRYRGNDTVIGVDLHNEPKDQATWGSGDLLTDWRLAAERAGNAVLEENPYLLVFVQGIQWSPWVSYWWGGNLQAVRDYPVRLPVPNRVVYSPHDYGPAVFPQPWFWDADFPDNLVAIWDQHWGYLTQEHIAPVVVGEFGDRSVGPDRDGTWQRALVDYLEDNHIGYIHWALNPDSSDTGGILADDWLAVKPERLALLMRYLAQPLAAGSSGVLGPPREALSVMVSNDDVKDASGLRFDLWLRNEGPEAVPLSQLELRYWFDNPEPAVGNLRVSVEGQDMPGGRVLGELVADGAPGQRCLRLTFGDQDGAIAAYRDSSKITVSITQEGVSSEPADGQSPADAIALGTNPAFALYRKGELVWGKPPDGQTIGPPVPATPAPGVGLPTPQGSRFWTGVNYSVPQGADLGGEAGPSHPGTAAVIDADFANLAAAGARVIKLSVFGPMNLPKAGSGGQDESGKALLADLDAMLSLADRHGLHIVFSLFDPRQGPADCATAEAPADDLLQLLADSDRRAALMDGTMQPLLDLTAGDPRVLAYEIIAQPPGGWGNAEAAVHGFAQETAEAIHVRGQALATVLTSADDLAYWSGLGLDYYSVRWVAQSAAEPPLGARAPELDRPLVVGEFALNSPGHGVSSLLSLALVQGYAGAFVGFAGQGDQLLWRGDYLAWARRHWTEIGYNEGDPPLPGQPLEVGTYGLDHLRLRAGDHDLYVDLQLRVGGQEEGQIAFALLPIGPGGPSVIADEHLSLSPDQPSRLRVRFPQLVDGQAYQLAATLWDDRGLLLAQFGELASFVLRHNDLVSLDNRDDASRCRDASRVAPLVRSASSSGSSSPAGRVEILAGAEPPAEIRNFPPGVREETVVGDAEMPVAMAFVPDGRLFFGELHTGRVRIVDREGRLQREPFLTLAVSGQPQAGLLGIAIDPEFRRNHYVYVLYTASRDGYPGGLNGPNRLIRVTEVKGLGTDPVVLVDNLPSAFILNGGGLRFGPDGYLYVGIGMGENWPAAADPSSLAGKVLRYHADGTAPHEGVFKNGQPAIYALGLASPFGLAFHPVTGQLYATDANGETDELNLVAPGGDHGAPAASQRDHRLNDPLITYWPSRQISGLDFYRSSRIREWQNDAFFCNARRGELHHVRLSPPSFDRILSDEIVLTGCQFAVVSGPDGALYYSDDHGIYRLARP